MIYSYDSYITRDEWNKLDLVEKNETLLQTAVVDGDINLDKKTKIIFDNKSIDYTVSSHDNIELTNDQIKINKAFSDIVINCKSDQTGEYYFVIDGLNSDESAYIGVGYNDVFKNLKFKGNKSLHYSDRHDYIINLGYMEGIDGDITITFPIEGLFSYSNIRIICQPLDKQIDLAKKLNNTAINKLVIDANAVESEIETDHDALVCLSIPYSEGWKVFVDGQEE